MVLQHVGGRRTPLADDCCENERTADGAALAFLCSSGRRLEDVNKVAAERRLAGAIAFDTVFEATEIISHLGHELRDFDIACFKDNGGVAVLGQGQQEMLNRHFAVRLLVGIGGRTLKRAAQIVRQFQSVQDVGLVRRGHVALFPPDASGAVDRFSRPGPLALLLRHADESPAYHSSRLRHTRQGLCPQLPLRYGNWVNINNAEGAERVTDAKRDAPPRNQLLRVSPGADRIEYHCSSAAVSSYPLRLNATSGCAKRLQCDDLVISLRRGGR